MRFIKYFCFILFIFTSLSCSSKQQIIQTEPTALTSKQYPTQANGTSIYSWYQPDFSSKELSVTNFDLKKRQVVTNLIYAFRFKWRNYIPGKLRTLEQLDPTAPELYFFKAMQQYRLKEKGTALVLVNKSLTKMPEYARAWNLKGILEGEAEQYTLALKSFENALKWATFNPVYLYNTASLLYRTGNYKESEKIIKRALKAKINLAEAYYLQGLIHREQDNIPATIKSFQAALNFGQRGSVFILEYTKASLLANNLVAQTKIIDYLRTINTTESKLLAVQIYENFGEFNKATQILAQLSHSQASNEGIRMQYINNLARTTQFGASSIMQLPIEAAEKKDLLNLYNSLRKREKRLPVIKDAILKPFL